MDLDFNDHGFNEHPVFNEQTKIPDFSPSLSLLKIIDSTILSQINTRFEHSGYVSKLTLDWDVRLFKKKIPQKLQAKRVKVALKNTKSCNLTYYIFY